jgi:hypothetical protein
LDRVGPVDKKSALKVEMKNKILGVLGFLTCVLSMQAWAEAPKEAELWTRFERLHLTYSLNADGSHVETRDTSVKILKDRAVERMKQASVSFSTSVEKIEVLHAYTLKPDGRRIDAPKSNYQYDINKGQDKDSPAFSDYTTLTVIFPDVAVGDVLAFSYKVTQLEPIFPGHFSVVQRFSSGDAYDDVRIRIDSPESLWTQHAATGLTEVANEEREGRKVLEWTYQNPRPLKGKRKNYSVYDPEREIGFSFSTFRNYKEISDAYGARARTKAVVTDRIRALAETITKDEATPRDQARALYEWVATNISYAGNCVGVGAVVPRELSFVIDNKMGDCKDHATLLQALLEAKGISSSQALINAGSTYRLPKVPVVSMVNHVINYIPSLNLYVDSTSETTPFGMLPMSDADKPVLLVDGFKDGTKTQAVAPGANRQYTKSVTTINPDGSVAGTIDVSLNGIFAVTGRDRLRNVTPDMEEEMFKNMYKRNNERGGGRIEKDDPKALLDTFKYKVTFNMQDFLPLPGAGAFGVYPLYYTEAALSNLLAVGVSEEEEAQEIVCLGGSSVEEYIYHLPNNMKVLSVPKNISLSNALVNYRSTYALKGNTLTVKRELFDKTKGNVCPISIQKEFFTLAKKALADVKAQVVYRQ